MKRTLTALCLVLALLAGSFPAARAAAEQVPCSTTAGEYEESGWGYVRPPEGPYWKYLTLQEASTLMATARTSGNPPFLIAYINNAGLDENDYSSVFTMAEAARQRGQVVCCVDLFHWERLACAYDTGLADYLPDGASTPIYFWYGGDPENVILVDAWILDEEDEYGSGILGGEALVETIFACADAGVGFRSSVSHLASTQQIARGTAPKVAVPGAPGGGAPAPDAPARAPAQALAAAAPAGEAPSPWAKAGVDGAREAGILPQSLDRGYTRPITRQEFCALVCAFSDAAGLEPEKKAAAFPDCADPLVLWAAGLGVIGGYPDGTFGPGHPIRRDEAASMLARLARAAGLSANVPAGAAFTDVSGGWAAGDVAFAAACLDPKSGGTLMGGTGNGAFSPAGSYTREQAALTFHRLLSAWLLRETVLLDAARPLDLGAGVTARAQNGTLTLIGDIWPALAGEYPEGPSLDLSALEPGAHTVELWTQGGYHRDSDSITLVKAASGAYYFQSSQVYAFNQERFAALTAPAAGEFLGESVYITPKNPEVAALAAQITAGAASGYDKLKAVADWVSGNLSYDWDAYESGRAGALGAAEVLHARAAVCDGYANLTAALLRAAGIPARRAAGYALGYGAAEGWSGEAVSGACNHAWNFAWADGRWVIVDATWGVFDPTVWRFSENHFWLEEDDESPLW